MTKTTAPPTWRDDYDWGFRVTDDGRIEPLTKAEAQRSRFVQPDATMQPGPQDNQLMSKHRVLSLKP